MRAIILLFFVTSANANDLYGLIHRGGTANIVREFPLQVYYDRDHLERHSYKLHGSKAIFIQYQMDRAVNWINYKFGFHAMQLSASGDRNPCEKHLQEHITVICYFPGEYERSISWKQRNRIPRGEAVSNVNYGVWPFWMANNSIGPDDFLKTRVEIYTVNEDKILLFTIIHELLHALGFGHVPKGVMSVQVSNYDISKTHLNFLKIDDRQLSNYLKEVGKWDDYLKIDKRRLKWEYETNSDSIFQIYEQRIEQWEQVNLINNFWING